MTELYTQSLLHIKNHYSTNLEHWKGLKSWRPVGFAKDHVIGIINLARLTGELSILPSVFLVCIFSVGSAVVHGFTREDGTRESLTPEDLALCFAGRTRLAAARLAALLRILHPAVSSACTGDAFRCKETMQRAIQDLEGYAESIVSQSPFVRYTRYVREGKLDVCAKCKEMIKEREKQEQQAIWGRLPELLSIEVPGWPTVPAPPPPAAIQTAPNPPVATQTVPNTPAAIQPAPHPSASNITNGGRL